MSEVENIKSHSIPTQLTGFRIGDNYYGVPVQDVQEVVKPHPITPIPLVSEHIRGLINLRGQIVTSLSLRKLFALEGDYKQDHMNVIVRKDGSLFSLVVDEILDVIDVEEKDFRNTPETLSDELKKCTKGVFVLEEKLIILLDLESII